MKTSHRNHVTYTRKTSTSKILFTRVAEWLIADKNLLFHLLAHYGVTRLTIDPIGSTQSRITAHFSMKSKWSETEILAHANGIDGFIGGWCSSLKGDAIS